MGLERHVDHDDHYDNGENDGTEHARQRSGTEAEASFAQILNAERNTEKNPAVRVSRVGGLRT